MWARASDSLGASPKTIHPEPVVRVLGVAKSVCCECKLNQQAPRLKCDSPACRCLLSGGYSTKTEHKVNHRSTFAGFTTHWFPKGLRAMKVTRKTSVLHKASGELYNDSPTRK